MGRQAASGRLARFRAVWGVTMKSLLSVVMAGSILAASPAVGAVYLWQGTPITVAIGSNTSAGTFNNTFNNGQTINKVIDAPTADAVEFHNQTTHIWFTADQPGGGLELLFDFQSEYDISTLHFWNYDGEGFDVDAIDFTFFNGANSQVGALSINPALGTSPGQTSQDIVLAAPLNVRYVTAFLTGSNRQVDFQNMGFSAEVSIPAPGIPEPATWAMLILGFGLVGGMLRRATPRRVTLTYT